MYGQGYSNMKGRERDCDRHETRDKRKANAEVTQNLMSQGGRLENGTIERMWAES